MFQGNHYLQTSGWFSRPGNGTLAEAGKAGGGGQTGRASLQDTDHAGGAAHLRFRPPLSALPSSLAAELRGRAGASHAPASSLAAGRAPRIRGRRRRPPAQQQTPVPSRPRPPPRPQPAEDTRTFAKAEAGSGLPRARCGQRRLRMRGVSTGRKSTSPCRRRVTYFLFVVGERRERKARGAAAATRTAEPEPRGAPGRRPLPVCRRRPPVSSVRRRWGQGEAGGGRVRGPAGAGPDLEPWSRRWGDLGLRPGPGEGGPGRGRARAAVGLRVGPGRGLRASPSFRLRAGARQAPRPLGVGPAPGAA
ncbi:translation initiation factor IF-2-like [Lemur catta]|uniref:translation initiation factor IF-2-like n=1 Tax=Lemur catta TaxID=9447 RepID=UPI001E26BDFF|nr:translation initiation factor IF-2-like [Lemur catta]